ncbi:MAG: CsiV family protein [Gammaproteobacteria bacterium]
MKNITALLLALMLNTSMAYEVGYEVEVIIFEDLSGKYLDSEQWLDMTQRELGQEYLPELPVEADQPAKITGYKINFEPGENMLLTEHVAKLLVHPEYKVHVHKVWKQPGLDKDIALPFEINSKEQLLDPLQYLTEVPKAKAPAENEQPLYDSYVDGTVTLIMSRYLHFNTNLVLHRTVDETIDSYLIQGDRRMRSRETHYMDHPMVGVIVIATPFKILTEDDKPKPGGSYRTL